MTITIEQLLVTEACREAARRYSYGIDRLDGGGYSIGCVCTTAKSLNTYRNRRVSMGIDAGKFRQASFDRPAHQRPIGP